MDIGTVMNALRDPAGVPAHPAIFQTLMVLTWVAHIFFVHLTLGSAALALLGARSAHPHPRRLAQAMSQVAKVSVSLLIVLGVAPLLFTQVIYDPQWYTANVLSARWVIAFIATLILGYCGWFYWYGRLHGHAEPSAAANWAWWAGAAALALLVLDGLIMHALAVQAIEPQRWMQWYAPGGVVDASGATLHLVRPARWLFIMGLSIPVTGAFLWAYADYLSPRSDASPEYLAHVRQIGRRWATGGWLLCAVLALLWQAELALSHTALLAQPLGWGLVVASLALWAWSRRRPPEGRGARALGLSAAVLLLLALWRELIRMHALGILGYRALDYPVHPDWPSLLLFVSTLVGVGGLVGGYFLRLLYKAGQTVGVYQADRPTERLANASVGVLLLWIAVFFAYGIVIYLRNSF